MPLVITAVDNKGLPVRSSEFFNTLCYTYGRHPVRANHVNHIFSQDDVDGMAQYIRDQSDLTVGLEQARQNITQAQALIREIERWGFVELSWREA
jgi:hypothetical protein